MQIEIRRAGVRCQTDGRNLRRRGPGGADGHGAAFRLPSLDRFAAFAARPFARGVAEDLPRASAERDEREEGDTAGHGLNSSEKSTRVGTQVAYRDGCGVASLRGRAEPCKNYITG